MLTKPHSLKIPPIRKRNWLHTLWVDGKTVCFISTTLDWYHLRTLTTLPGTPVDESPHDDGNPDLHNSNNFDYRPIHKHDRCPFAAHTRKMRPRGDLDDDHAVIIRRGITYGDEVTPEEKACQKSDPDHDRGLLFVCYQSDINNGFNFLTTREIFRTPQCKMLD